MTEVHVIKVTLENASQTAIGNKIWEAYDEFCNQLRSLGVQVADDEFVDDDGNLRVYREDGTLEVVE